LRVAYDPRRISDIRAWLTEKLGPLAHFGQLAQQSAEGAVAAEPRVEAPVEAGSGVARAAAGIATPAPSCGSPGWGQLV